VGSQPFGGEGLSGTGPKAGGPHYLERFTRHPAPDLAGRWPDAMRTQDVQQAVDRANAGGAERRQDMVLPGPTGESNRLTTHQRPALLCLGPGPEAAAAQAEAVRELGGVAAQAKGTVDPEALRTMGGISGALWWGDAETARALDQALSQRAGPILPLITGRPDTGHALYERHVCVDTTAAGGNAALLGGVA
jgi:RHH-type proline utilization regulon transcriptional repressor/proline dehydrogenase/delta 1-pyrroline-5-carboxylate dehydrogenase